MRRLLILAGWISIAAQVLFTHLAGAAELRLAVTTSFHNSGLSDVLLPQIKEELNLDVRLLIVGTGQALKLGRAGDVDAILVHSRAAEEKFVSEGFGTHRREIMYNDFVLVGPSNDPASVRGMANVAQALKAIKQQQSVFVSRGDDSGTHRKEKAIWRSAGLTAEGFGSNWYRAVGSGMGATLNTASAMNAYVLADRASWLKFKNKGDLQLLFAGDPVLFNQYAYLPISADIHEHVNIQAALALESWLVSETGQGLIADYKIGQERLFTPNAKVN
ncbi:MAG: sulfate ABC transporter substrate-binding protein [Rhizobiaceae bacterium]|nr:sulfate ABC transporter substrate-binding protein [Rhizobiaceae bacterium]